MGYKQTVRTLNTLKGIIDLGDSLFGALTKVGLFKSPEQQMREKEVENQIAFSQARTQMEGESRAFDFFKDFRPINAGDMRPAGNTPISGAPMNLPREDAFRLPENSYLAGFINRAMGRDGMYVPRDKAKQMISVRQNDAYSGLGIPEGDYDPEILDNLISAYSSRTKPTEPPELVRATRDINDFTEEWEFEKGKSMLSGKMIGRSPKWKPEGSGDTKEKEIDKLVESIGRDMAEFEDINSLKWSDRTKDVKFESIKAKTDRLSKVAGIEKRVGELWLLQAKTKKEGQKFDLDGALKNMPEFQGLTEKQINAIKTYFKARLF